MRKTEEKTDAPPFSRHSSESFVFFFYEREKQFLKLGLCTLNKMHSLFFLFTLLLFRRNT